MNGDETLEQLLNEIDDLARQGKTRITFSANCSSGTIGTACQCWRCRSSRGQRFDEETEAWAERVAREERESLQARTWEFLRTRREK